MITCDLVVGYNIKHQLQIYKLTDTGLPIILNGQKCVSIAYH
jgi:hypothetical protein